MAALCFFFGEIRYNLVENKSIFLFTSKTVGRCLCLCLCLPVSLYAVCLYVCGVCVSVSYCRGHAAQGLVLPLNKSINNEQVNFVALSYKVDYILKTNFCLMYFRRGPVCQ